MKKLMIVNAVLVCSFLSLNAQVINLKKIKREQPKNPTYQVPMSPTVSAALSGNLLNVAFEAPVGIVQIAVESASGTTMLELTNSNAVDNWTTPIDNLDEGNYTLTIETEEEVLEGDFEL